MPATTRLRVVARGALFARSALHRSPPPCLSAPDSNGLNRRNLLSQHSHHRPIRLPPKVAPTRCQHSRAPTCALARARRPRACLAVARAVAASARRRRRRAPLPAGSAPRARGRRGSPREPNDAPEHTHAAIHRAQIHSHIQLYATARDADAARRSAGVRPHASQCMQRRRRDQYHSLAVRRNLFDLATATPT
eukprot:3331035-Pleurochrysis_carterae.AAC.2